MIKKTIRFLGIIIFGVMFYLAYINHSTSFSLNYIKGSVEFNILTLSITVAIISALATGLILQANISEIENKAKKQSRKTEKAGIEKEEAQDKIKLLEAKIQTLEKALSDVLKGN